MELVTKFSILNTVSNIPQLIIFLPDKLMTGIDIAPGRNGNILTSGAAARKSLINTGTAFKIYHEMEEIKGIAFFSSL